MENEDSLAPICATIQLYNPGNNLLNNLLEEGLPDRDAFHSYPIASLKQQPLENHDAEENQRFDLRTIQVLSSLKQKEEFNRTFPEKIFSEVPEEDAFQMNIAFRKCLDESILLQKKPTQINKTAYLNQNRYDKIARYREKKARRIWERKISYDCRKVVADKRERKNGRFIKKEEDKGKESPGKNREPKIQIILKQQQDIPFKVQAYYD